MSNTPVKTNFLDSYYYKDLNVLTLAKDLVLYGERQAVALLRQYNLTPEDMVAINKMPVFIKEVRELRAIMDSSPQSTIQMKARDVLEEGLQRLSDMIKDPKTSNTDVIKAVRETSRIALQIHAMGQNNEASDNAPAAVNGLVLNVNLAGASGLSSLLPPIDVVADKALREVEVKK